MGDNGGQCRKLPYMACDSEMGWFWGWQKESSLSLRSLKPQDTKCFTVTPSVTRFDCRADSHSIPSSRMKSDNTEACHCEINLTTQNDTSIHWSFLGGGTAWKPISKEGSLYSIGWVNGVFSSLAGIFHRDLCVLAFE